MKSQFGFFTVEDSEAKQASLKGTTRKNLADLEAQAKLWLDAVEAEVITKLAAVDAQAAAQRKVIKLTRHNLEREKEHVVAIQPRFVSMAKNAHRGAEGSLLSIEVDDRIFRFGADQVKSKGGYVNDLSFRGFGDPRDEDGIFHWQQRYVSAADVNFGSQFYLDTRPKYVSLETGTRLEPLIAYLQLDDIASKFQAR